MLKSDIPENQDQRHFETVELEIFPAVYRKLGKSGPVPECRIEYYPYRNIKNTLRIRGNTFHFRISDLLRNAPAPIIESIFEILICRTFRIPGHEPANRMYSLYLSSPEFLGKGISSRRATAGNKTIPNGLFRRFERLNRHYFDGTLRDLDIFWVRRRSRRILGQFIPHRDEILLNSELDHPLVPDSVIDFIIYHEMLHACLDPLITAKGRKIVHHAEFRRREKEFEGYGFVNEFIKENF